MLVLFDRLAQAGLALGITLTLQPWWDQGLRTGFFMTLVSTVVHIVTTHLTPGEDP